MYLDWIISSLLGKGNQGRPGLKFVSNLDSFVQQDNVNKLTAGKICPQSWQSLRKRSGSDAMSKEQRLTQSRNGLKFRQAADPDSDYN